MPLVSPAEVNDAFQRGDGFMNGVRKMRRRAHKHAGTVAAVAAALAAAREGQRIGQKQGARSMAARVPAMLKDAEGAGRANAAAHHQRQLHSVRTNARKGGHEAGMADRRGHQSVAL